MVWRACVSGTSTFSPGEVAFLTSPVTPYPLTFTGTTPTPNLPRNLLTNLFYGYSMQTPAVGTYEAITGRSPGNLARMYKWNITSQSNDVYTCSNGVWSPSGDKAL